MKTHPNQPILQLMALVDALDAQLPASCASGEKLLSTELTAGKESHAAA